MINNFENTVSAEAGTYVSSDVTTIEYTEWENYPTEVWVVAPASSRWSIDGGAFSALSDSEGASIREDGQVSVKFDADLLNGATVQLECEASPISGVWEYFDINFPMGEGIDRESIGWNVQTV